MTSLLALAVASGLAVVPATSAQAAPTESTSITIKINRQFGVFYDTIGPNIPEDRVIISGALASGEVFLPDQTVTLYRQMKTGSEFKPVTSKKTASDGTFSFNQPVVGSAAYGVAYDGDDVTYQPSESNIKQLPAMRDFNAIKRKANGKLYFQGNINPGWGNRTINLVRKKCGTCSWATVGTKQTGSGGGWAFRVYYPAKVGPRWTYQAVVKAEGNFVRSYSATLEVYRVYARGGAGTVATLR
jgi:hypothetical protein